MPRCQTCHKVKKTATRKTPVHADELVDCDEPYRIIECKTVGLNLTPPECVLQEEKYKELYDALYVNVDTLKFDEQFDDLLLENTEDAYNELLANLVDAFGLQLGSQSPRILLTESDGTVVIDTSKTNNSLDNWKQKLINENHNTRVAVLASQLYEGGVGYETKYSTSVGLKQHYVAVRLGKYLDNPGSLRLSKNAV